MSKEINSCCPCLRTMRCGDTKDHRHLICKAKRDFISNSDTVYKCISNHNWEDCKYFNEVYHAS
jgi:hypothetical protein